jgi:ribosomal protein S18 acetylase RimI-like enzyme
VCYGILRKGAVIAYCLLRDDGDYYYIRQLFTDRPFRRSGLASRLLDFVESAVMAGKPVRLEVLAGNGEAFRFYEKRGYRVYCHTLLKSCESSPRELKITDPTDREYHP